MPDQYEAGSKERKFILLSIVFLILTHSFSHLFGDVNFGKGIDDSSLARKVLLCIYLASIFYASFSWKTYFTALGRSWMLWTLVVLSIISISWAVLPPLTFRRSTALILTTIYGIYLAERVELSEMIYLLAKVFAILITINLFIILVFPEYGVHHSKHFGAWRGFFSHKNSFGQMMLFAGLIYFTLGLNGGHLRKFYWSAFILCGLLILKSNSQTALLTFLITCSCTPFLKAIRWRGYLSKAFYISGFIITALSSYTIAVNINWVTELIGRDATFTGRTEIWQDGLALIMEQPWLGYGFGTEWVRDSWGFTPAWHPRIDDTLGLHNGYLELTAQLGITGLLLFAIVFLFILIRAVKLAGKSEGMITYWPLYYLIFMFVYNFFEAILMQQNSYIWIMFVMIFSWLTQAKKDEIITPASHPRKYST